MCKFPIVFGRCNVLLLALICCSASANVCRVTTGGTNAHDGSTWSVRMDLQSALGTPTCTEIWVAAGAYLPTTPGGSYTVSFVIAPGTAVYGGFAGSETERTQRNLNSNVSTLSGDIGVAGVATDNSHNIVRMTGTVGNTITASTVLDGFTISGAYQGGSGGGMYCNGSGAGNECSPTLANLQFINNYAVYGGGLYNDGHNSGKSSPHLTNVTFKNNVVVNEGGAMYNDGSGGESSPVLNGVTFSGNTTDNDIGGAMEDYGNSNPVLTNVTFSGNGSNLAPNGIVTWNTGYGGAIAIIGGSPVLNNVTFSGNSASVFGGAIYNKAGAVLLSNTILWGDSTAGTGPEIYQGTGTTAISSSVIQGGCPSGVTCFGVITTDPMLGALQDNGGPTQTMILMAGSSAIDGGYNPTCAAQDQRGVPRPQGPNCDAGALEVVFQRVFADNFDGRPTP
jgi:predicted outer membrane repeat protein